MAISILKSHNFRNQLLWPNNGGFRSRRFTQFPLLLLPHHRPLLSHSLPLRHCFRLHPPPLPPLLRRRLHPLLYPMSSLSASQDAVKPTPPKLKLTESLLVNFHVFARMFHRHVRMVIKGRVQGVFYRNWTIENAKELGLKGWVRNRRDGSVEALFSGSPEKVQEMEQRCRRGPPDAVVTGFQVVPSTDDPGTSFEQETSRGLIALKLLIRRLQNHLQLSRTLDTIRNVEYEHLKEAEETVPDDVQEGHFAVLAVENEEEKPMRFVVELGVLNNPAFLRLLKLAEEEYGFQQKGVLTIPCRPNELQRILQYKIRVGC
ncbi:Acylphosphatase [Sesamum angolense]|uniref:acylphosphatase n=1 Tax=Sesamum angolense TaxID=2727404 RepID=A0AAE1W471_9LAMI|nr:Acylphosphatase [Sesamum angolense]